MTKFDFIGKRYTEETAIGIIKRAVVKMTKYTCFSCVACEQRVGSNKDFCCKFDKSKSKLGVTLKFDVRVQKPCNRFIPAQYIEAINFDLR